MEEELKCPSCLQLVTAPVLLPCFHSMCLHCALANQQTVAMATLPVHHAPNSNSVSELSELGSSSTDCNDSDQLSILSETDSGVVVSTRPSSYVGTST